MTNRIVDDLSEASRWKLFASGGAKIAVSSERFEHGDRLKIDFDFNGQKGFVGIRLEYAIPLPDVYAFSFRVGGTSPPNMLEFKLSDAGNLNAWRSQHEISDFPTEGRSFYLKSREINFVWGPAGGGRLRNMQAVEFVITALQGGSGSLWIEDFQLVDLTPPMPPEVTWSSSQTRDKKSALLEPERMLHWRPEETDHSPWLKLDFRQERELGGLVIDWGTRGTSHSFVVEKSDLDINWEPVGQVNRNEGRRCFLPLPNFESRFLRLCFSSGADIHQIEVQPFDFSRTKDEFLFAIAQQSPRGWFPRYFTREQSYWTCAGSLDGTTCAVINEEGLVEPDRGSFSLEPFLRLSEELITWAKVVRSVRLEQKTLPIPTAVWMCYGLILETTVFTSDSGKESTLLVRYRLTNTTSGKLCPEFNIAIRPHQVTPPWQSWKQLGGVSEIRSIGWDHDCITVNDSKVIVPLAKPSRFGAMTFQQGLLFERIEAHRPPVEQHICDEQGLGSAVLSFDIELAEGETRDIYLAIPFGFDHAPNSHVVQRLFELDGREQFSNTIRLFQGRLKVVEFGRTTGLLEKVVNTFRTATGQILIDRSGPALQPGPRRYTRCWIRDAAIMGAALLRAGEESSPVECARWYAQHQRDDGFVPCCVDQSGPDELVEYDSQGQLIYAIVESFRFTRDFKFLREMWPHVQRSAQFIESLRQKRLTPEYEQDGKSVCRGLLPESVSHEGYLSQPVHSFWDDFWALRGLKDTAFAASELGFEADFQYFSTAASELKTSLLESIREVIRERQLNYIPGSVEWGDFDPTATANALFLMADTADFPSEQLAAMYEQFLTGVRQRQHGEIPWHNYSAYEIRNIGAFVRLGRRSEALELLAFYLSDCRPRPWNQWPEISWRKPRTPGHLGDIPHTWIAAEFILAMTSLFAYERDADQSLVIAAGIDSNWIDDQAGLTIRNLPTWYGHLDLSLFKESDQSLRIVIGGTLRPPPGGFILRPPGSGVIGEVTINGQKSVDFSEREIRVRTLPSEVMVRFVE